MNELRCAKDIPQAERDMIIGQALAANPFMSKTAMSEKLASEVGMTSRSWFTAITRFLDERGLSYTKERDAQRTRQIVAAEEMVQQIIDGRKGSPASLLRLLSELTGTAKAPPQTITHRLDVSSIEDPYT